MSYNQPPPNDPTLPGPYGPPPIPPPPQPTTPRWARKRIAIPAALLILFVGVGIGSSDSQDAQKTSAEANPTVTVTATTTLTPKVASDDKAKPQPTVTVTTTKTVKPAAKSSSSGDKAPADDSSTAGKVVFKVWGKAPAGVDITYGSDSDNRQGSGLPMTKTLKLDDDAMYYSVSAQLMGGGDINCSVTVDGETKKGHASGGYNICMAQLSGGLFGGWE